jgi:hypothetical protein
MQSANTRLQSAFSGLRLLIVTGERHHHRRGSTRRLHDQDDLVVPHQRHQQKPHQFVGDRSDGGTCQWCYLLGFEASLKGSMVVFAFDYYFFVMAAAERRESLSLVGDGR